MPLYSIVVDLVVYRELFPSASSSSSSNSSTSTSFRVKLSRNDEATEFF